MTPKLHKRYQAPGVVVSGDRGGSGQGGGVAGKAGRIIVKDTENSSSAGHWANRTIKFYINICCFDAGFSFDNCDPHRLSYTCFTVSVQICRSIFATVKAHVRLLFRDKRMTGTELTLLTLNLLG